MKCEKNKRRDFLKGSVAIGLSAGIIPFLQACEDTTEEQGEMVKLLSPEGELVEVSKDQIKYLEERASASAGKAREGIPGKKFIMVIDLALCKNARKCVTSCQEMHFLDPDHEWIQVKLMRDNPKSPPYWFPKTCFHCDNPPCVKVCPVSATYKRSDGLVLIDADRCIGCKFCMAACPYSTRNFNWKEPEIPESVSCQTYSPETGIPSTVGTVGKCDFCPDAVRLGKLPDCVTACPNGVLYFGDENEDVVTNGVETIRFSDLIMERSGYRYMEELGTEPRVYYLPPKDRIFPVERGLEGLPDHIRDRFTDVMYPDGKS